MKASTWVNLKQMMLMMSPGVRLSFYHLLAVWPQESHLPSLILGLVTCKIETAIFLYHLPIATIMLDNEVPQNIVVVDITFCYCLHWVAWVLLWSWVSELLCLWADVGR